MYKGKRRLLRAAALVSVTVLGLSACGSGTSGQESGSDNASGANGEATTIEFWHRTFTPVENDWYKQIVADFNESQDEIYVNVTEVPADAWDQKMKSAQAAGNAPDVYTHSGSVQDGVAAGQFYNLNEIVSKESLDQIVPAAKAVSAVDDVFYAYPLLLEPQSVLFWNKAMLDEAGVASESAPKTWEDLFAACDKIMPTLEQGAYCIAPAPDAATFAWATVGQQWNFSGHRALNDAWTEPTINDPGYKALFETYKTMWDKGYMAKQATGSYLEAKDFGELKAAFKVSGSWMMSEVGSDFPELLTNTGVGAVPSATDPKGDTTTTMGDFKWVVDARAKHPEEAGKFLEWAIGGDPENLVPFFVNTQFTKVPSRPSVSEAVSATTEAADAPWSGIIMDDIAPTAIAGNSYPWDVSLSVGTAMEKVMKGAATFEEAVATAEDEIRLIIERENLPERAPSNG